MAKISIQDVRDAQWRTGRSMAPPDAQRTISDEELDSLINVHQPGGDATPQLLEIKMQPNVTIGVHAHDESEIIYVVAGEMRLGTRTLGPGSSVAIEGGAFYSFSAGPEGLRFVNFRPRRDFSFRQKGQAASAA